LEQDDAAGLENCKRGFIKPIVSIKEFPAAQIEEAFRYMQKGQHVGQIVVNMA
jgi:D-arabinose 1-dehydrogenase-like Zn-dependent alcohol dehydrogenase